MIDRIARILIVLLLPLLACACATTSSQAPLPPDAPAIASQVSLMGSLQRGESIASTLAKLPYRTADGFDLQDGGQRLTALSVYNGETGARFGLFFVDDKLRSVLSAADDTLLRECWSAAVPLGVHWTDADRSWVAPWLDSHDLLAAAARMDHQTPNFRQDPARMREGMSTFDTATTLIAYSPFLLVSAPFLVVEAIRDERNDGARRKKQESDSAKWKARLDKQREGFALIRLGMTQHELIQVMGPSDRSTMTPDGSKHLWYDTYSAVLLRNNVVMLKERFVHRPHWEIDPKPRSQFRWFEDRGLDPAKACAQYGAALQARQRDTL